MSQPHGLYTGIRHTSFAWRVEPAPCCAAPRLLKLVTNGEKQWKCMNCDTVRPRE